MGLSSARQFLVIFLMNGALLVSLAVAANGQQRGWFSPRRTVTKMIELKSLVVTSTPSSCVAVQTSLPPCRHIRHIDFAPTRPTRIYATRGPEMQFEMQPQQQPMKLEGSTGAVGGGMIFSPAEHQHQHQHQHEHQHQHQHPHPHPHQHPHPHSLTHQHQQINQLPQPHLLQPMLMPNGGADQAKQQQNQQQQQQPQEQSFGWISLFGLQDHTITNTVVRPFTKTVTDPNTIVTFSVKGCHPSRLPFDLGPCEDVYGDQSMEEVTLAKATGAPSMATASTREVHFE